MIHHRLAFFTMIGALLGFAAIFIAARLPIGTTEAATLDYSNRPQLGDPAAPVKVALFEDFFCPACATFSENVMPTLLREYVTPGRVSLTFHHFSVIEGSDAAGRLTECVRRQSNDAFWDIKAPLYRVQDELKTPRRAREIALSLAPGIVAAELDACMLDAGSLEAVRRDTRVAQALSLRGTPAVLVNGVAVSSPNLTEVRRAIDAALR
jgi:protein-disulfide isomerase